MNKTGFDTKCPRVLKKTNYKNPCGGVWGGGGGAHTGRSSKVKENERMGKPSAPLARKTELGGPGPDEKKGGGESTGRRKKRKMKSLKERGGACVRYEGRRVDWGRRSTERTQKKRKAGRIKPGWPNLTTR